MNKMGFFLKDLMILHIFVELLKCEQGRYYYSIQKEAIYGWSFQLLSFQPSAKSLFQKPFAESLTLMADRVHKKRKFFYEH